MPAIPMTYVSDVLCVWAYVAQARIDEIRTKFGDQVMLDYRFCSVFGDTATKIPAAWGHKGGYEGFSRHLQEVAKRHPHIEVNPDIWTKVRPRTSASAHLFLKAVQLIGEQNPDRAPAGPGSPSLYDRAAWKIRCAFFRDGRDIATWDAHAEIAAELGVGMDMIEAKIRSAEAVARLAADYEFCDKQKVEGSPTIILNDGRQRLFGNVGYRVIEANVNEILRAQDSGGMSWC
ncbi:MAG: DsbA family protein [Rhodospirillales bacterium]|nr:DsbA family protein [Rhodospirillales bacterium]